MDEPYFIALLSNGHTLVQDLKETPNTWIRLGNLIKDGIKISQLQITFQNRQVIGSPMNQPGYFFGRKITAVWPMGKNEPALTGLGHVDENNVVQITWYRNDGSIHSKEERSKDKAGFFLIENN
jgi:hypothetical protein